MTSEVHVGPAGKHRYPLDTMEVGQWFVLPDDIDQLNFRTYLYRMQKKLGRKFETVVLSQSLIVKRV